MMMGTSELFSVPYALYAQNSGDDNRGNDFDWLVTGNDVCTGMGGGYPTGNVGIGTTSPSGKLHVMNTVGVCDTYLEGYNNTAAGDIATLRMRNSFSGDLFGFYFKLIGGNTYGVVSLYDATALAWRAFYRFNLNTQQLEYRPGIVDLKYSNAGDVWFNNAGDVGIGTTSPGYDLDVSGNINATNYFKAGVPLKEGQWTVSGSDIYYNTGNVAIGTFPTANNKLDVYTNNGSIGSSAVSAWQNYSGTNPTYGVKGIILNTSAGIGTQGAGVLGQSSGATGSGAGVLGTSAGNQGVGVFAYGTHLSGINFGLYAKTDSPNGFAGFFSGGKNYFQGKVGIGTTAPAHLLHVSDNTAGSVPQVLIENKDPGGDASLMFDDPGEFFTLGMDNDDNKNFEISNNNQLSGVNQYQDGSTRFRIHNKASGPDNQGIIDMPYQSRIRMYLSADSSLNYGFNPPRPYYPDWYGRPWLPIPFDMNTPLKPGFDEQNESILLAPSPTVPSRTTSVFVPEEAGYYQINSRFEVFLDSNNIYMEWYPPEFAPIRSGDTRIMSIIQAPILLSIGIFVNGNLYSQGNNFQMNTEYWNPNQTWEMFWYMNAPNISDVIYLDGAGDYVEICVLCYAVWQGIYWVPTPFTIRGDTHGVFTYVSIHKNS